MNGQKLNFRHLSKFTAQDVYYECVINFSLVFRTKFKSEPNENIFSKNTPHNSRYSLISGQGEPGTVTLMQ